jgi:hypothetical protein
MRYRAFPTVIFSPELRIIIFYHLEVVYKKKSLPAGTCWIKLSLQPLTGRGGGGGLPKAGTQERRAAVAHFKQAPRSGNFFGNEDAKRSIS